jgi:hypothetical protein
MERTIQNGRLDEEKLDQLRRWGSGLSQAESDEFRATGKAILLLIEEIEALHVDLWNEREARAEPEIAESEDLQPDLHRSLAQRLRFGRGRADAED